MLQPILLLLGESPGESVKLSSRGVARSRYNDVQVARGPHFAWARPRLQAGGWSEFDGADHGLCRYRSTFSHSGRWPDYGLVEREIAMNGAFVWTLLFAGNATLLWLWVNYCLKALRGQCPHCGK